MAWYSKQLIRRLFQWNICPRRDRDTRTQAPSQPSERACRAQASSSAGGWIGGCESKTSLVTCCKRTPECRERRKGKKEERRGVETLGGDDALFPLPPPSTSPTAQASLQTSSHGKHQSQHLSPLSCTTHLALPTPRVQTKSSSSTAAPTRSSWTTRSSRRPSQQPLAKPPSLTSSRSRTLCRTTRQEVACSGREEDASSTPLRSRLASEDTRLLGHRRRRSEGSTGASGRFWERREGGADGPIAGRIRRRSWRLDRGGQAEGGPT